ncbi:MAG: ribosomal protein S18-alanine N-acetyltransferase [Acidimicrobiia bacterium]
MEGRDAAAPAGGRAAVSLPRRFGAANPGPRTRDLEVRIGPMRRRHLRGVLRIEQQVYPRPWTFGLFLSEIGQRSSRVYVVARVGSEVVGYAGLFIAVGDAHITTVAVDPAWQRRGIATRLLLALARAASERGCTNLTLEVRMSNAGAQVLYRRFGFRPAGVRKGYYPETGEDALVMWATDIDSPRYAERLAAIEAGVPGSTVIDGGWI